MCKLLMNICNPETTIGAQVLRDEIKSANYAKFNHHFVKILEFIKVKMDMIIDMGKINNNLLRDTFDALLSVRNADFVKHFSSKKLKWKSGKSCIFLKLFAAAKAICDNMKTNKTWNAFNPKDTAILALRAEVS